MRVAARLAAALGVLVFVATVVGSALGPPWSVDERCLRWFVDHRSTTGNSVARSVTVLGSSPAALSLVALVGLTGVARRRNARAVVFIASAWAGGELLFQVTKALVGRARPPAALGVGRFSGLAFPSGHATLAAAVWGALALVVVDVAPRWHRPVYAIAMCVVIAVGVTRLYLGAHWLTDVLVGWALGASWTVVLRRTLSSAP